MNRRDKIEEALDYIEDLRSMDFINYVIYSELHDLICGLEEES